MIILEFARKGFDNEFHTEVTESKLRKHYNIAKYNLNFVIQKVICVKQTFR